MVTRHAAPLFALVILLFFLTTSALAAVGDTCSSSSKCDSSAPCCGDGHTCGSGAQACAGGCDPMASHSANSCLPNPICVSQNVTFHPEAYNNASYFRPILQYNGDASLAPFTLDAGSLGKGPEGVLAQMTIDRQAKLSSTRYFLYGDVEVKLRHNATTGVVATFILMSDIRDEIDWEFTTSDPKNAQSNYFSLGVPKLGNGQDVGPQGLNVGQWNTFGLNWQPDRLQWKINGQVVRTLKQSEAGSDYPRSPSRVQLSVWAGGNSTVPEGTRQWAGGDISYNTPEYTSNGYYAMEIASYSVTCASQSASGINTQGTGANVTSWVYTGSNDTTNHPAFALNKNSITFLKDPSAGGHYGVPGWPDEQTANTKSGKMWDGSGDTGAQDSKSSSGGFNKQAALKYGVPIAAGVVSVIALWFVVMCCVRRKRKQRRLATAAAAGASTGISSTGDRKTGGAGGYVTAGNVGKVGPSGAKYAPLEDTYATYSDEHLPMGTEVRGTGIGPAPGPRPGDRVNFNNNHGGAYSQGRRVPSGPRYTDGARAMMASPQPQHQHQQYASYESYAMTPQQPYSGHNNNGQWARMQTPQAHQSPGWGSGGGYAGYDGYGNQMPAQHAQYGHAAYAESPRQPGPTGYSVPHYR